MSYSPPPGFPQQPPEKKANYWWWLAPLVVLFGVSVCWFYFSTFQQLRPEMDRIRSGNQNEVEIVPVDPSNLEGFALYDFPEYGMRIPLPSVPQSVEYDLHHTNAHFDRSISIDLEYSSPSLRGYVNLTHYRKNVTDFDIKPVEVMRGHLRKEFGFPGKNVTEKQESLGNLHGVLIVEDFETSGGTVHFLGFEGFAGKSGIEIHLYDTSGRLQAEAAFAKMKEGFAHIPIKK